MGLNISTVEYLLLVRQKFDVRYEKTAMLGRQYLYLSETEIGGVLEKIFNHKQVKQKDGYAENMFHLLGANDVVSYDYSDYEGATFLHDMNVPIPDIYKEKYDVVFDGGTLEHVFNYLTALKNAMEMVKIGGNLILATPTNNYNGHGFYQFSPDLFFSVLEGNGFKIEDISLVNETVNGSCTTHKLENIVCDGKRFWNQNINAPGIGTSLHVCARKIGKVPNNLICYQANYEAIWKGKSRADRKEVVWFKYYELERELESIFGLDEANSIYSSKQKEKIKLVLYGAGETCVKFMKNKYMERLDIVAIADSDVTKHGKKIENVEIIPPDRIDRIEAEGIVITTSERWIYEIKNMLIEHFQLEESRIYVLERFFYYMGDTVYC